MNAKKPGRVENLKPFLPGTSGNPAGRPKTAALSAACREKLGELVPGDPHGRTYAQCIADRLGELAIGGNISAALELADRAERKPRISLQTTASTQYVTSSAMGKGQMMRKGVNMGTPNESRSDFRTSQGEVSGFRRGTSTKGILATQAAGE